MYDFRLRKIVKYILIALVVLIFVGSFFIVRSWIRNSRGNNNGDKNDVVESETEYVGGVEEQTGDSGINFYTPDGVDESYGYPDDITSKKTSVSESMEYLNEMGVNVEEGTISGIYEESSDVLNSMTYDENVNKNGSLTVVRHSDDLSNMNILESDVIVVENATRVIGLLGENTVLLCKIDDDGVYDTPYFFCLDLSLKLFPIESTNKLNLGDWFSFSFSGKNSRRVNYGNVVVYYVIGGIN